MTADWDENSAQLQANLEAALIQIRDDARARTKPTIAMPLQWQRIAMQKLVPKKPEYVGAYRGSTGVEVNVVIGRYRGAPYSLVADELSKFQRTIQRAVAELDSIIAPNQSLTADDLAAVIDLCAWAHSEWVRIHPLVNGNGRTARLWANFIAMRYGLPPFVRLRPRPDGGYGFVSEKAMLGEWQPTAHLFRQMLKACMQ